MITRLAIFDFDGTLFNSPLKPQGFKGGWWGKDHSLLPPFVPHHHELKEKGSHLLNRKVSNAYLEALECPDTHAVMMTGRHWGLHKHVMNILHAFDLCTLEDKTNVQEDSNRFIFISGGNTLQGKLDRLTELFIEFPDVNYVEMWEDREEHIPHFINHSEKLKSIRDNFSDVVVFQPPWA